MVERESSLPEEEVPKQEPIILPEQIAPEIEQEEKPFAGFTLEQEAEILKKQQILSSLAYFIGKDFKIPVELNKPGAGWHWDFKNNVIRVDPKDLLEKPMDYLRCNVAHEGGHRRITRVDFVPLKVWRQPGFSFMTNAIEDCRMDNFLLEAYPKYREQLPLVLEETLKLSPQAKEKAKAKLGHEPRSSKAGMEYIRQWFRETKGQEFEISEDLPQEVKDVVDKTLKSAQDSWLRYPSRQEADSGEDIIKKYAKVSYEINRDEVWPEFKKLVDMDIEDQKMQQALKDLQNKGEEGEAKEEPQLPKDLQDKLTPDQIEELKKALKQALKKAQKEKINAGKKTENGSDLSSPEKQGSKEKSVGQGQGAKEKNQGASGEESGENEEGVSEGQETPTSPVDLDSLSNDLKNKLKEYIDSLPEEEKEELIQKATEALEDFMDELNKELQGKLVATPEDKAQEVAAEEGRKLDNTDADKASKKGKLKDNSVDLEELKLYKDRISREVQKDANVYERYRTEIMPLIDKLENELRKIFTDRKTTAWKSGFRTGKRINISKRIQEKAKQVSAVESKAWQNRELPQEKNYAISLLVDLSGSMAGGGKIEETFKAVILMSEVLNRLSISVEILGFNNSIYEYQNFGQQMSGLIRERMGGMLKEVDTRNAGWNDDGWAVTQASARLAKQKADQKFLVVFSDGMPEESRMHPPSKYELGKMISKILEETDNHLIGVGVGYGTEHVSEYYPNSIANVKVEEMAEKLADLIKDVIANYEKF